MDSWQYCKKTNQVNEDLVSFLIAPFYAKGDNKEATFVTLWSLTNQQHLSESSDHDLYYQSEGFDLYEAIWYIVKESKKINLYKSCILSTEFDWPPNLARDKGIC